jgi:(p)ppGpp synthase/HD superfamily hydrolase
MKKSVSMSQQMLDLAIKGHGKQKRHNGEPYVNHPIRVGNSFKDEIKRTLGFGHDLREDKLKFYLRFVKPHFPKEIDEAIDILTRRDGENYFNFIMRIRDSQNVDAVMVKVADVLDNLADHDEGSKKDKYRFALYILANCL